MQSENLTVCIVAKNDISVGTITSLLQAGKALRFKQLIASGQSDLPKIRSNELTKWFENAKQGEKFMFIDSDQTFTTEDIQQCIQLSNTHDVVCGGYAKKTGGSTILPKYPIKFSQEKRGDLWYGSTGFMLINYNIVEKIVAAYPKKYITQRDCSSYPFFYERLVDEPEIPALNIWLSEDYSFCWLVRQIGGIVHGFTSPTIGHIIPTEKFLSEEPYTTWPEKSIVYYCHASLEKWSPKSIEKGIGASETAVIKLSKLWTDAGYKVVVYCPCDEPGVYGGVEYRCDKSFNWLDKFDTLVIWRNTKVIGTTDIRANRILMDLHDNTRPMDITDRVIQSVTLFMVKSNYQAENLRKLNVPKDKIFVIPNGGAYPKRSDRPQKDPNYLIYASSYDRGLSYMLMWGWPKIKAQCPDAHLKIFYGWDAFDAKPQTEMSKIFKDGMKILMQQNGVEECGRVSHEVLEQEKSKALIHYYVGNFQEIDCVSVRESASVGTIPVVSAEAHVFKEKPYCYTVYGDPQTQGMQEDAADQIVSLMKNPEITQMLVENLTFENETWEAIAKKWLEIISK